MDLTDAPAAVTIWHNPACSTSRRVLETIRAQGIEPQIIRYLDTGWTRDSLSVLLTAAGLSPARALRRKGDLVRDLGLLAPETPDTTIFDAMLAHPALVERPFVQTRRGTALCRPPERLADLLPTAPNTP